MGPNPQFIYAGLMELVDMRDLGSCEFPLVWVQVPYPAPSESMYSEAHLLPFILVLLVRMVVM